MALTEKQKAVRSSGVGGSEVAAVLGVNPHMTPFDVWAHKTGRAKEQIHDQDPVNNLPAFLGTKLEPLVAEVYEARHPGAFVLMSDTITHPDHPFAIVTPDREVFDLLPTVAGPRAFNPDFPKPDRLLEIKTKSFRTARGFGDQGTDELPADVLCQAHWQLFVTRVAVVDVAVLIDGRDYREYRVHADPELHAQMLEQVRQFWHGNVLADIPPELKGREVDHYLRQRFVMHDDTVVRADGLGEEWLEKLHEARQQKAYFEELVDQYANQVKALIGTRKGIQGTVGKATWSQTKDQTKIDWEAIAKEYRGMIEMEWQQQDIILRDGKPPAEVLDEILRKNARMIPGYRRFLFTPAKGE